MLRYLSRPPFFHLAPTKAARAKLPRRPKHGGSSTLATHAGTLNSSGRLTPGAGCLATSDDGFNTLRQNKRPRPIPLQTFESSDPRAPCHTEETRRPTSPSPPSARLARRRPTKRPLPRRSRPQAFRYASRPVGPSSGPRPAPAAGRQQFDLLCRRRPYDVGRVLTDTLAAQVRLAANGGISRRRSTRPP